MRVAPTFQATTWPSLASHTSTGPSCRTYRMSSSRTTPKHSITRTHTSSTAGLAAKQHPPQVSTATLSVRRGAGSPTTPPSQAYRDPPPTSRAATCSQPISARGLTALLQIPTISPSCSSVRQRAGRPARAEGARGARAGREARPRRTRAGGTAGPRDRGVENIARARVRAESALSDKGEKEHVSRTRKTFTST